MGSTQREMNEERGRGSVYRIEVAMRPGLRDAAGEAVRDDILDLGIDGVRSVRTARIYRLEGELSRDAAERIAGELLADGVSELYAIDGSPLGEGGDGKRSVEVAYNPGVMDPVALSVSKAIRDLGIGGVWRASTGRTYLIEGALTREELATICNRLLLNRVIEHIATEAERAALPPSARLQEARHVSLTSASKEELIALSRSGQLFLDAREMAAIQNYFRTEGREPSDIELETLAQTWSEHCVHKTMRGLVDYEGERIDNLLGSTIMRVTRELAKDWCVSVFEDNAGIVAFDEEYNICFKVETHNHPSALEPYGGAGTGIGGVLRDPMGTGLGAKPVLSTDVFCFAPPDTPYGSGWASPR
jgi:phosphoribosylformylglycinamidine (FGAM) synthase PurS component